MDITQNKINLVIVAGVMIMAIGAWTVPWYQGELAVGLLAGIDTDIANLDSEIGDVLNNQVGTGLDGNTNLATLSAAGADSDTLQSVMGTEFTVFENQFLEFHEDADDFQNFEIITFELAQARERVPFDLAGTTITEFNTDNPDGTDDRCDTDGSLFDQDGKYDTAGGGEGSFAQIGGPSVIYGVAVKAPEFFDGAADAADHNIQLQICDSEGDTFVDEIFQLVGNEIFTKNFDYGLVPPGVDLNVIIDDDEPANGGGEDYRVWIFRSDPSTETIPFINDDRNLLAGSACTQIVVEVTDDGGTDGVNDARVEIGHFFLPIFAQGFTSGGAGGTVASITFNADSFGLPDMPGGDYFIDVFGPSDEFPAFADVFCDNTDANQTIDIDLVDASTFVAGLGGGTGTLTVNIFDQFGAPLPDTISFVDAGFAPIIFDICEDGDASNDNDGNDADQCFDNLGDFLVIGGLTDAAADGTYTLTGLPVDVNSPSGNTGKYYVEVCQENFFCNFTDVTITASQTTTLDITIFVPFFAALGI